MCHRERDAIRRHLTFEPAAEGKQSFSAFMAALRDARKMTGRDQDSGQKTAGARHGSWLGALGYMALLDQVGSCFMPHGHSHVPGGSFSKALMYFADIDERTGKALYALRCSFAHDYGLINNERTTDPDLIHHFRVTEGQSQLVTLPGERWDGKWPSRTDANRTTVDLECLGDLVEGIYRRLLRLADGSGLRVVLSGGANELEARYYYWTTVPKRTLSDLRTSGGP